MRLRLLYAVLASLVVWPRAAAADPVTFQLRLSPGDSRHYTEGLHTTISAASLGTQSVDITLGVGLSVEDVLEDGSATVRETIDQFDVGGDLADQIDTTPYLGTQITFTARPDGSFSDFQMEGGDQALPVFGSGASFSPSLPPAGLEVGQSYDVKQSLPLPLIGTGPLELPVQTMLDAVVIEQDRASARLIQTIEVSELEVPFGPFGAFGAASLSADGQTIYLMALDTGWPVKIDGVTAVRVNVAAEGSQQGVDETLEMHIVMDDEALSAED